MRKTTLLSVAVVTCLFCFGLVRAEGQEKSAEPKATKPRIIDPYRLDFSFNELEDGKKINTRHYSMNLTSDNSNEIKIGSRVPVSTASITDNHNNPATQYQYVDIGTNVWAQFRPTGNDDEEELIIRSEVSDLDLSAQARSSNPVIRQIKIQGSTLLVPGRTMVIGSMDDPNSKRQFQLEVTVTKLR
jgi:hypothetical protein